MRAVPLASEPSLDVLICMHLARRRVWGRACCRSYVAQRGARTRLCLCGTDVQRDLHDSRRGRGVVYDDKVASGGAGTRAPPATSSHAVNQVRTALRVRRHIALRNFASGPRRKCDASVSKRVSARWSDQRQGETSARSAPSHRALATIALRRAASTRSRFLFNQNTPPHPLSPAQHTCGHHHVDHAPRGEVGRGAARRPCRREARPRLRRREQRSRRCGG